ncbi:hypothetical protein BT69DRAFT_1311331 [Atractiella rhizophila]|nr:hypothetical protein BT69DRAFT_1311331 [Atractiella rhizophila]
MSSLQGLPAAGVGNLNTLLKRLEAATSRLEDVAQQFQGGSSSTAVSAPPEASPAPVEKIDPPQIKDFDEIVSGSLLKFINLSAELGGLVNDQAQHIRDMFTAQRDMLVAAQVCKKPADSISEKFLGPTRAALTKAIELRDKNRAERNFASHLNSVAEGAPTLGWVMIERTPVSYCQDMIETTQFWTNRIMKEKKDTGGKDVEWSKSFITLLTDLKVYVQKYYKTGLEWNPKGTDPAEYNASKPSGEGAPAAAPPAPGPPPPPPPPPPMDLAATSTNKPAASGGDMGSVFASINKGSDITKGLKKVDPSQQTHKNPSLRESSTVPASSGSGKNGVKAPPSRPLKPPKPHSFQKKPPKKELDGKNWMIENQDGNRDLIIDQTELNQSVNIFSCKNSTIQIKGKVNAVSLVGCDKVAVVVESVVSMVSVTSSPSFQVQIMGKAPTILIDNTDSGMVYLSKDCLDCEIITAKTSAINVLVPEGEEGDFSEKAVPEQMKSVVQNGKLVTTIVEHAG